MKKIILIVMCLMATTASAQMQTLLKGDLSHGAYCGPVLKIGQIDGETKVFMGGQGGWVINNKLVIGGGGWGLVSEHNSHDAIDGERDELNMGYGGFIVEYMIASDKLLHITLTSLAGAGAVSNSAWDSDRGYNWRNTTTDRFFILEGGLNIMLNVTDRVRVGGGATYRRFDGISKFGLTNADYDGLVGMVLIKFGKF